MESSSLYSELKRSTLNPPLDTSSSGAGVCIGVFSASSLSFCGSHWVDDGVGNDVVTAELLRFCGCVDA